MLRQKQKILYHITSERTGAFSVRAYWIERRGGGGERGSERARERERERKRKREREREKERARECLKLTS
jgi:hypothetical protein